MKWLTALTVILIVCQYLDAWKIYKNGRRKFGNVGSPVNLLQAKSPPDEWLEQKLDHFNPTDTRIWEQRYFTNDSFYKPGGPVFLMIGGEGEAGSGWMTNGAWIEYAEQLKALCFQVEHRYYGKSRPTADLSVENLAYLSSQQALADLANFIAAMNNKYQLPEGTKWIAFGGSYAGSLSAWLREKYSHLVYAAVSSSGPLLAKLNFEEYFGIVTNSLDSVRWGCSDSIQDATDHIGLRLPYVKDELRLCDETNTTKLDISNLYETLAGYIASIVQYDGDNISFNNITIYDICQILTYDDLSAPIIRYSEMISELLDHYGQECLDFKYDKMIAYMRNISWDSDAAEGSRQWTYQTCTEFGYYQTSDMSPHVFGEEFPLDFFIQQCSDIFGPEFNLDSVSKSVERTNTFYGGDSLGAERVVYVNGYVDPWHALGVTDTLLEDSPAIFINDTAHCADMYPSSPDDPAALTYAREEILEYLTAWIND